MASLFYCLIAGAGGYFGVIKPLLKRNNVANNFSRITGGPILTDQKIEIIASQDKREVFSRDFKSALSAEEAGGNLTEISVVKIINEQKSA